MLDEAEEIRFQAVSLDTLLQDIYGGRIQDAKTVAGILAYANRECRDLRSVEREC